MFNRNVNHKIKIYHEPVDRDINIITTGVIGGATNKDKYPGTLKKDNATSIILTLNALDTFDDNIITKIRLQINTNEVPCTVVINKVVPLDAEGNEALELYYNTENGDVFPYSGNVTWRNSTYQNMGNDTWKANIEEGQKAYYTFHFSEPTGAGFAIRNIDNAGSGGSGKDFVIPAGTTCYRYVAANPANNLMYLRRQAGVSNICIASITKTLSTEMQSVAINATGISSFVTDVPLDFTDKDVEVFVVESTSDVTYSSVTLKKVDKVAPGAYFVKGTSSTTVDNIAIYTEEIDAQSNILSGSTVFTGKATENTTRYALSNKDGMFHPVQKE